jgi:hypothetical protein
MLEEARAAQQKAGGDQRLWSARAGWERRDIENWLDGQDGIALRPDARQSRALVSR